MAGLIKTLFRVGIITAACGGLALVIAGPTRASAIVGQAHTAILSHIDGNIDDPVALRTQLRDLEREYPERIAQVRGDLAELKLQMRQLERERAVAERVVSLAERDISTLAPLVAEASVSQGVATASAGIRNVVSVQFDNRTLSVGQAQTRLNQVQHTRVAYANRAADASHDVIYLAQQAEQLETLLTQLESERAQFQSQLWQLDRQVDAIARNDKLIEMLEKRQRTIDECSRYEVASLDQMVSRLDEVRVRQQAELDHLTGNTAEISYEDVAKLQLDSEGTLRELEMDASDSTTLHFSDASPKLR